MFSGDEIIGEVEKVQKAYLQHAGQDKGLLV